MKIWQRIRAIGNDKVETVMELRCIVFENRPDIAEELGNFQTYVFTLHREGLALIRASYKSILQK